MRLKAEKKKKFRKPLVIFWLLELIKKKFLANLLLHVYQHKRARVRKMWRREQRVGGKWSGLKRFPKISADFFLHRNLFLAKAFSDMQIKWSATLRFTREKSVQEPQVHLFIANWACEVIIVVYGPVTWNFFDKYTQFRPRTAHSCAQNWIRDAYIEANAIFSENSIVWTVINPFGIQSQHSIASF